MSKRAIVWVALVVALLVISVGFYIGYSQRVVTTKKNTTSAPSYELTSAKVRVPKQYRIDHFEVHHSGYRYGGKNKCWHRKVEQVAIVGNGSQAFGWWQTVDWCQHPFTHDFQNGHWVDECLICFWRFDKAFPPTHRGGWSGGGVSYQWYRQSRAARFCWSPVHLGCVYDREFTVMQFITDYGYYYDRVG